jgi:hypothetical protein
MQLTITHITTNGVYADGRAFTRTTQVYTPLQPGDSMQLNFNLDYNWEVEPDKIEAPTLQEPQD